MFRLEHLLVTGALVCAMAMPASAAAQIEAAPSARALELRAAATALEHGLTVATRNVRDFEQTGVRVVDPFS